MARITFTKVECKTLADAYAVMGSNPHVGFDGSADMQLGHLTAWLVQLNKVLAGDGQQRVQMKADDAGVVTVLVAGRSFFVPIDRHLNVSSGLYLFRTLANGREVCSNVRYTGFKGGNAVMLVRTDKVVSGMQPFRMFNDLTLMNIPDELKRLMHLCAVNGSTKTGDADGFRIHVNVDLDAIDRINQLLAATVKPSGITDMFVMTKDEADRFWCDGKVMWRPAPVITVIADDSVSMPSTPPKTPKKQSRKWRLVWRYSSMV